ncbi:PREDICTED: uncharacterized protein LOC109461702 isoform X2 [Branchiostoma belcheri]|uniref:Uncharacterized protein LOC109461702 isoform X2 n=1 Tax=Branchiostoma belcheri TaxID=7741 RepID=A0A6P4XSI8_BRABE|nr:PREDICTED: uncharacterized protein LOC109461702 isoform X2 [Branchiostoma belcheri]
MCLYTDGNNLNEWTECYTTTERKCTVQVQHNGTCRFCVSTLNTDKNVRSLPQEMEDPEIRIHTKQGSPKPELSKRANAHNRLPGSKTKGQEKGSIIFVMSCQDISGLRDLWMNYKLGNMEPFFKELLSLEASVVTGNGELDIEINEEDFYACRQHLLLTHAHAKGFRVVKTGNARFKACTPMGLSEDYPVYCKPLKYNTTCSQLDYLDPAVFTSQGASKVSTKKNLNRTVEWLSRTRQRSPETRARSPDTRSPETSKVSEPAVTLFGAVIGDDEELRDCQSQHEDHLKADAALLVHCWAVPDSAEQRFASSLKVKRVQIRVTFEVRFDSTKPDGFTKIMAPGSQPILEALQDDSRLQYRKFNLVKVFLDPEDDSKIKGEPNLGSPCSSIAGGKFKARFNKQLSAGQILSDYNDDELKSGKRCKFYVDVSEQRSKSKWITKMDPIKLHFPVLLIDCLPDDTLLSALLRDGRINVSNVRSCMLIYKTKCGDNNIAQLTDDVHFHHDNTFVCTVIDEPQVGEDVWEEAVHNKVQIDHTVVSSLTNERRIGCPRTESPGQKERINNSGSTPEVGNPCSWANNIEEIIPKQMNTDLQSKKSKRKEMMRRNKLDKFTDPFVHNVNQWSNGMSIQMMQSLLSYSNSVGVLFKDDHMCGTCFRVGPKFILTNHHVMDIAGLSSGNCSGAFVHFNYLGNLPDPNDSIRYNVKEVIHSQDELDYSFLELEIPENKFQRVQEKLPGLEYLIGPIREGSTVTIIGHQLGGPKNIDVGCPLVNPAYYSEFNPNSTGGADFSALADPRRATYKTCLGAGSSGSPVFDEIGNLIAVHTRGCLLYKGSPSIVGQGITMTAIADDIKKHNPELFTYFPKG